MKNNYFALALRIIEHIHRHMPGVAIAGSVYLSRFLILFLTKKKNVRSVKRWKLLFVLALSYSGAIKAQDTPSPDSVTSLQEVTVEGYISGQPLLRTPTSVGVVSVNRLQQQGDATLVSAVNTVPGVRMEERSPGSYRLSIRGSLLRSPWGVRNVKVYLDEFPLTDAGGNTYLNLLDPRAIARMEVLKGPHGSLFGANSGGVLLVNTVGQPGEGARSNDVLNAGLSGGSYGLFHEDIGFRKRWGKSQLDLNQAFLRSDGYREHSGMRRHYLQATHRWNYRPSSQLKVLAFYADMEYDTPGGLNREQYEADPRQARPPAGPNPGAVEQQAGIRSKTFFGGLSHQFRLAPRLRHMAAVFGSHTDFENPFITNYEVRDEDNYGLRTYLELDGVSSFRSLDWKWQLGLEWQRSGHNITNYDNLGNATKGDLQAADAIRTTQYFYFTRFTADLWGRLQGEAAVSLNYYRYVFSEPGAAPGGSSGEGAGDGAGEETAGERRFSPQWMPRLSLSYLVTRQFSWRASVSKGFSPPTTAEIRPSNIVINTALHPETGWNHETGFRFTSRDQRLQADASVFYYRMKDAIVRRLDEGGDEFFVNAGGTNQTGIESMVSARLIENRDHGLLRGLRMSSSYTYSRFRFRKYQQGGDDFSGNELTGVPQHIAVTSLSLRFPRAFQLSAQHNFTSRIPLDDAGSVYADAYHLLQLKLTWKQPLNRRATRTGAPQTAGPPRTAGIAGGARTGGAQLELFVGADNVLNEKYSLGNDINAFGGRYYNAAPLRNFFAGVRLVL